MDFIDLTGDDDQLEQNLVPLEAAIDRLAKSLEDVREAKLMQKTSALQLSKEKKEFIKAQKDFLQKHDKEAA